MQFRRVLRGLMSRREVTLYLGTCIGASMALLAIACGLLAVDDGFSILTTQISHSGSPRSNPRGWPFFVASLCFAGVAVVPVNLYFRRGLARLGSRVTGFATALVFVGSAGIFLVGLFPASVSYVMHVTAAAMALGGYGFSFVLQGPVLLKNHPGLVRSYGILYGWFVTLVVVGFSVVIYTFAAGIFDAAVGTWMSFSLWEWLLYFALMVMLLATAAAHPAVFPETP